ncbi:MAG: RNase adapter RapZ [Gammaproteobacteria bacterium]|nr:RNase adapter RapZ [Gammaproteobacteria bacterium]
MKLVIVSGLSGSGKTVALHTLEDEEYYCVDNLHLDLLNNFVTLFKSNDLDCFGNTAVSIDARSCGESLENFPKLIKQIKAQEIDVEIIFLQASVETLIKRFSETRRKHPLTHKGLPLVEAISLERSLLNTISSYADLMIDTSQTNIHELRALIKKRLSKQNQTSLSLIFQSFGYKHGVPLDSDYVFDVRCLPNPYWSPGLRGFTGQDSAVIEFLEKHDSVEDMFVSVRTFLEKWIPHFEADDRSYLNISIGCTGGQHRSVYLTERLTEFFKMVASSKNISIKHRELE